METKNVQNICMHALHVHITLVDMHCRSCSVFSLFWFDGDLSLSFLGYKLLTAAVAVCWLWFVNIVWQFCTVPIAIAIAKCFFVSSSFYILIIRWKSTACICHRWNDKYFFIDSVPWNIYNKSFASAVLFEKRVYIFKKNKFNIRLLCCHFSMKMTAQCSKGLLTIHTFWWWYKAGMIHKNISVCMCVCAREWIFFLISKNLFQRERDHIVFIK